MAQKVVNILLLVFVVCLIALFGYKIIQRTTNTNTPAPVVTNIQQQEEKQKAEEEKIKAIVKDYVMNNPEVIIESINQLQKRKMEEMEEAAKNYIAKQKPEIENTGLFPILGNPNGDVIIVSFYDYNCNYCKKGDGYIAAALESDKNLKVILRPFPVLGENSLYIAKIALAVNRIAPSKFSAVHDGLMKMKNPTTDVLRDFIVANGIDIQSIDAETSKPEIQAAIDKTFEIANNVKIQGVPAYIINGRLVPGLIDLAQLKSIIAESRQTTQPQGQPSASSQNNVDTQKNSTTNDTTAQQPNSLPASEAKQ